MNWIREDKKNESYYKKLLEKPKYALQKKKYDEMNEPDARFTEKLRKRTLKPKVSPEREAEIMKEYKEAMVKGKKKLDGYGNKIHSPNKRTKKILNCFK